MASVSLRFSPPEAENIVALRVYESTLQTGPWNQIDRTTVVGVWPTYIDHYKTTLATVESDWFAIAWEDDNGVVGPMSIGVKGDTYTLVGSVVGRVLQRDSTLDEAVVRQEAEAAIEGYFEVNPYTVDPENVSYRVLNGLTYLALARSMIDRIIRQQNVTSATIGLVTMRSDSSASSIADVSQLIEWANRDLGLSFSIVMLMEEIQIGSSIPNATFVDQSRLLVQTEIQ